MWPQKRISIIVDTSTSMNQNDPQRYAAQIAKILGDLVNDSDRVQVVRMPPQSVAGQVKLPGSWKDILRPGGGIGFSENCDAAPNPSLAIELSGADRGQFKGAIDSLLVNDTGTYFAMALNTSLDFLGTSPSTPRMLLFLADSGGFGSGCASQLTQKLIDLRRTGAYVALINLGSSAGGFSGNPGFDSTAAAPDSEALVRAVAQCYQRFLGGRKVQTGSASSTVEVMIDPYVKEAYLVVAADGPVTELRVAAGNPGAASVETDFRGGGSTVDARGFRRGYRIVRLTNPNPGKWTVEAPGVQDGGWMLIQDYSIALRAMPVQPVAAGSKAEIRFEVVDSRNGQRIKDPAVLSGMKVDANIDGAKVQATPNGDGTFSASHQFSKVGTHSVIARVSNGIIDREAPVAVEVAEGGWNLVPQTVPQAEANSPLQLKVKLEQQGAVATAKPDRIIAQIDGDQVELTPAAGDTYTGSWTPATAGRRTVTFTPVGGFHVSPATAEIDVRETPPERMTPAVPPSGNEGSQPPPLAPAAPSFRLGSPKQVEFGSVHPRNVAAARIAFENSEVPQDTDLRVSTDLSHRGATLEIETPSGWRKLSHTPILVKAAAGQPTAWAIRLTAAECPALCRQSHNHTITFVSARASGGEDRTDVPVNLEVVPGPWLACYWKWLAAGVSLLLAGVIIYGFIWPAGFGPRLGVQLSPEIDLSEGCFHILRQQPGSRIGFYRHARVFVRSDYRITGKSKAGALARLRAGRRGMFIQPVAGQSLWRQRMDGEWERLGPEETPVRESITYRNEDRTVFFDLRIR
ncbi:MAG: hypothetical protein JNK87_24115 [Bryobacterales bacterium]|nr:hypothetical protein [Bryobacterales bacterium]